MFYYNLLINSSGNMRFRYVNLICPFILAPLCKYILCDFFAERIANITSV